MEAKIIRSEDLVENDYGDTRVTNVFESEALNVAKIRKIGDEIQEWYDIESDVAYYVLEWEGRCVIDWEENFIKKGDLVFYTKGTSYKHLKGLTLLAISNPPFDRTKRVYVKS